MKKSSDKCQNAYSAPEFTTLIVEGEALLSTSPITWENNITDPSWDIDGDYGLE